jgi:hypothetical protein
MEDVERIRMLFLDGRSGRSIARDYDVTHVSIYNILKGKTYDRVKTERTAPVKEVTFEIVKGVVVRFE